MRILVTAVSLLLTAATAQAEPISVNKGQWFVTQDIYYEASNNGEPLDFPAEHTTLDECWMQDDEVLIDESMVAMFEGCSATEVVSKSFGLDIGLACNFSGMDVAGSANFSVSHGRDSFVAQVYLATLTSDPLDFESHILMIGHRTGSCQAPG